MGKSGTILLTLALAAMLASGSASISMAHGKSHGAHSYQGYRISGLWRANGYWYPQFKDCYFPYRYDLPVYCDESTQRFSKRNEWRRAPKFIRK
jgi:hypothetical protein